MFELLLRVLVGCYPVEHSGQKRDKHVVVFNKRELRERELRES